MNPIYFATTNAEKLLIAQTICTRNNLQVEQVALDIDEIQGENPELIVRDKAARAYEQFQKPVIVSDDSWNVPALNGFPGAYMKSINYWFTPEDFLRLMHGIEDRRVVLQQWLAYTDGATTTLFSNDIPGRFTTEARGPLNPKSPNMSVIELDDDNGRTIAEVFGKGESAVAERYKTRRDAWHGFVAWYAANVTN